MNGKMIVGFVLGVVLAATFVFNRAVEQGGQQELPVLGTVTPFTLTDSNGEEFRSTALTGDIWVANFFFTSCKGICPTIMGEIKKVHDAFVEEEALSFVSITVDPERDRPEKLRSYKAKFTNDTSWKLLTGEKSVIDTVSEEAFQLAAASIPDAHSQRIVLIDNNGLIRGYYNGLEKGVSKKVKQDLATLIATRK